MQVSKIQRRFGSALENHFILERLGCLQGKRVLDIGCGLGESSITFALRGATVTATDISPRMVAFTQELAAKNEVKVEGKVGAAEVLTLEDASFDVIYAANMIHHLADKTVFLDRIQRWLAPTGLFCSWDPVKYNPIINVYRKLATDVRTEDEEPLGLGDLQLLSQHFSKVEHHHFWLLSLSLFLKYFLIDRVSPNEDRYWKRIYKETDRSLWWWKPLNRADEFLLRIPGLRWLSWNVVFLAQK